MIIFDGVSATVVKETKGDVLIFQTSKDYTGKVTSKVVYNAYVPVEESLVTRSSWDSFHNQGERIAGFDTKTLLKIDGDSVKFNRYFLYAPYGGVFISTMPSGDARYVIQSIADNKDQYDAALASFKSSNAIKSFSLYAQSTNANGSYSIYKGV